MPYDLPRKYLSYSAFILWLKDREAFRRKYYLNEPSFENTETIFGKKVHEQFEKDGSVIGSETHIETYLTEGLKLLGNLDSFDEKSLSIIDFKTGHLDKNGRMPWDKVKVQKHKQLVFYSLLVWLKFGKYNRTAHLKWIETRFKEKTSEFKGHTLKAESRELELTGYTKTFTRKIYKYEIQKLKKEIIKVAKEISEDYTQWKKKN